jgi:acetyltransferase-like isoleucine patch superfamily enzyme
MLHRARGVKIGDHVFIGEEVYLDNDYPECIEICEGAQINIRTTIIAHTRGPGKVIVGKNASVGQNTTIACSEGRLISIGEGAVIGPGSVITKSVPPRLYVAMAPPRPLARVEVPLTTEGSIVSFRAGLRPLKNANPAEVEKPAPPVND